MHTHTYFYGTSVTFIIPSVMFSHLHTAWKRSHIYSRNNLKLVCKQPATLLFQRYIKSIYTVRVPENEPIYISQCQTEKKGKTNKHIAMYKNDLMEYHRDSLILTYLTISTYCKSLWVTASA